MVDLPTLACLGSFLGAGAVVLAVLLWSVIRPLPSWASGVLVLAGGWLFLWPLLTHGGR